MSFRCQCLLSAIVWKFTDAEVHLKHVCSPKALVVASWHFAANLYIHSLSVNNLSLDVVGPPPTGGYVGGPSVMKKTPVS